ncbi:MAG: flagellar biosynthetic protein FliO [Magnetococcales bacterium]|nr:flagellar biosynthetic protein FliO [Magnetococcales bacterium]
MKRLFWRWRRCFTPTMATVAISFYILPVWAGEAVEGSPPIDLFSEALRLVGYLIALGAVALLFVHLGKRIQPKLGASGPVHLIGGRNLAPNAGVRLVRVGRRGWLVGVTRDRVTMLAELDEDDLKSLEEPFR